MGNGTKGQKPSKVFQECPDESSSFSLTQRSGVEFSCLRARALQFQFLPLLNAPLSPWPLPHFPSSLSSPEQRGSSSPRAVLPEDWWLAIGSASVC